MSDRCLPVRPNLTQLKHLAKDLLRQFRSEDPTAVEEFRKHHPEKISSSEAKLADAQRVLARSYEASGWSRWTRLVFACKLIDGIWRDDLETVRSIIRMLYERGARDIEHAIGRATLQGKIQTARMLYAMLGAPPIPQGALGGPAYTLSSTGTAFAATAASRPKSTKSSKCTCSMACNFLDTPVMALHRGRIDLLEEHLRRDPRLFERTFSHQEIFPPEFACSEYVDTQGTPLQGTTLLHMCVDWDEFEIAEWLVEKGADVNAKSAVIRP
jgi:hypothetical protein